MRVNPFDSNPNISLIKSTLPLTHNFLHQSPTNSHSYTRPHTYIMGAGSSFELVRQIKRDWLQSRRAPKKIDLFFSSQEALSLNFSNFIQKQLVLHIPLYIITYISIARKHLALFWRISILAHFCTRKPCRARKCTF